LPYSFRLGLFGPTIHAVQRTKEIGVEKFLGASVLQIIAMLSGSFVKLIVIAMLIAFPVAWYFMNKWLENFAYKVHLGWIIFFIAEQWQY
jgi:putative ABC transport system permease protein